MEEKLLKKVGITGNFERIDVKAVADKIGNFFEKFGTKTSVFDVDVPEEDITFAIAVGGDGTILKTSRFYSNFSVPVFGINLGRLGFLAQTSEKNLETNLRKIVSGKYRTEERIMLKAEPGELSALNDIVIKGDNFSRTARFTVFADGNPVCDYLADGLIISTPTGSTAYNISAGGPIIEPSVDVLVMVPVCPHTLNTRPIVISSGRKIEIKACDNTKKLKISADGQITKTVDEGGIIKVKKSDVAAKLLFPEDADFYEILQNKLYWGLSGKKC